MSLEQQIQAAENGVVTSHSHTTPTNDQEKLEQSFNLWWEANSERIRREFFDAFLTGMAGGYANSLELFK